MDDRMNRKQFIARLGHWGAGACACALVAGVEGALTGRTARADAGEAPSGETPPDAANAIQGTKPGEKSLARAAKRMEFGDTWVRRFFDVMDKTLDADARRKLMLANGKACYEGYAGPPKLEPGGFERFAQWVADKGKDHGYSIEGRVVAFEFIGSAETGEASPESLCLCPMAEARKPGELSPTFCLCSLGYVKEMHERIIGRPIEVELVDSVLKGGKRCRFRMTLG